MDKTEKYTVAGLCFGGGGVFLCEDAVVCARVYGYCDGTVVEFCLGITCIVIATVSLYIAGMLRDRRVQAEFARRCRIYRAGTPRASSRTGSPPRRARAPQGRTGEPGMVTPWGTREGALRHVAHIDRY